MSAADDARVEVRQYALGGGTLALGSAIDLAGDRARADLTCRYHARRKDVLDNASTTFLAAMMPSVAALMMPPAYPAPSPVG